MSSQNFSSTEMVSIDTAHRFLNLDFKTVRYWIKKLNIKTFPDILDKRKTLITFKDMEKIRSSKRKHGYAPYVSFKPKKYKDL